jgi:thioredoxin-like negative regulator of GroEL
MKTKPLKSREEFESAVRGPEKKVVLFYSAWCPFCLSFMPAFEKQAAAAPDRFLKACTDDADELEDLFSIDVVPTVLCFEGGKLTKRLDGQLGRGLSAEQLSAFVKDRCPEERKK